MSSSVFAAAGAAAATLTAFYLTFKSADNVENSRKQKNRYKGIPGLVNLGNTCYVNTVLQALASCHRLRRWLNIQPSSYLKDAVHVLLADLNYENGKVTDPCSCESVISTLSRHGWIIPYEDQDAHELFSVLCSTIKEEVHSRDEITSILDALKMPCESQKPVNIHHRVPSATLLKPGGSSFPFDGCLASQLTCIICGTPYPVKLDTFSCLSVTFPPSAIRGRQVSVEELLRHYTSQELVHDVHCTSCSPMKTTFIKRISIGKLPSCLCIHIQRSVWFDERGMTYKRFDPVRFSELLNLTPFLYLKHVKEKINSRRESQKGNIMEPCSLLRLPRTHLYQLQACVVHTGDTQSGHFATYRRRNDNWFYTSDTVVRNVQLSEVLSSAAYMLFYELLPAVT